METNAQFSMVLLQGRRECECSVERFPVWGVSEHCAAKCGEEGWRRVKEQVSSPRGPYGDTAIEVWSSMRLQEDLWRQREVWSPR